MIKVENVSKFFGRIKALNSLTVKMPRGICGLIGPNGAGKTTLIHMLVGLIRPSSGVVRTLDLEPWSKRRELMKKIGVLLERDILPQDVTCIRYLQHIAKLRNIRNSEVVEALRQVELLDVSERKIVGFSAGMKKRLGIAKAMLGNPELIILDEPTANLDPVGRTELLGMVERIFRDKGVSFIISSHVLPELQKVCSWVCLMHMGKIVEHGFIKDLLDKYSPTVYIVEVIRPKGLSEAVNCIDELEAVVKDGYVYIRGDVEKIRKKVPELIAQMGEELISFHQADRDLENVFIKALGGEKSGV
ncbi:MAG: ABC transporter ATP-binding protein [Thermoproteota archaeon]